MPIFQILVLAIIQGLAELLPVSSSAHVIVAEKLMHLDPSAPEMTFLLVMLHTGTMFAVIVYFWKRWLKVFSNANPERTLFVKNLINATIFTGIVGLILKKIIEKTFFSNAPHAEIEQLFSNLPLMAISLASVAGLIYVAGVSTPSTGLITSKIAGRIGMIQGLCLPFRGFSRSGATISIALLNRVEQKTAEEFSFALAVILTPPVILRELYRLLKAQVFSSISLSELLFPGVLGMVFSFAAGIIALRWVSSWIEKGKWKWFGYYCFVASLVVLGLHWFTHFE